MRAHSVLVWALLSAIAGSAYAQDDEAESDADTDSAGEEAEAAGPTEAQLTEGREHFEVALTLYRSGRFAEASTEFERAYELTHRAELLHNIYLAQRDLGNTARAADALRRYLDTAQNIEEEDRAFLTHRLEALDAALGTEDGASSDTETGDGSDTASPGGPATGGGGSNDGLVIGGIVVLGVGVVGLVISLIENQLMEAEARTLNDTCTLGASMDRCPAGFDSEALASRYALNRDLAWSFLGIGAGLAALGTTLLILGVTSGGGGGDTAAIRPNAHCGANGCVATLEGSFQ